VRASLSGWRCLPQTPPFSVDPMFSISNFRLNPKVYTMTYIIAKVHMHHFIGNVLEVKCIALTFLVKSKSGFVRA